jgi:hypothetical protein
MRYFGREFRRLARYPPASQFRHWLAKALESSLKSTRPKHHPGGIMAAVEQKVKQIIVEQLGVDR